MESLGGELEEKAINVAKAIRNMESSAAAIRQAEVDMAKRRTTIERRAGLMRGYLMGVMSYTGVTKIDSPYFTLSIQNNPPAVNVYNEEALPPQFKTQVVNWKIDKDAIKKAIKYGYSIVGAELTNSTRLVIR
jgi:hypothetical protein